MSRRVHTSLLVTPVIGLDAFVFDGKYLFDNTYEAEAIQRSGNTQLLVNLDGLQRDRIHVTQDLAEAFPRIRDVLDALHGPDHGRLKILMIDFAFYVMQRHATEPGRVVVQINQQSNDLRATNLMLLPGTDRKDYRSTDIVPRDGILLGVTRYLPRSVTICKVGGLGMYNFKITDSDGRRQLIGFAPSDAPAVYLNRVVPEMIRRDAMFHERNAEYQELCRTYFIAFPSEATTMPPADLLVTPFMSPVKFHPRGKEQIQLKKRIKDESAAKAAALPEGMRECKTCASVLPFTDYDVNRLVCKYCRKGSRAVQAATVVHGPATAMHPEACSECKIAFNPELFIPRGKGYRGICRACVNGKGYLQVHREREREKDEECCRPPCMGA